MVVSNNQIYVTFIALLMAIWWGSAEAFVVPFVRSTASLPISSDKLLHTLNYQQQPSNLLLERPDVAALNLTDTDRPAFNFTDLIPLGDEPLLQSATIEHKKPPFILWPSPVVVSKGNYAKETWLERHIGGPLYLYNDCLPRLPIPTLQETIERFIPTALPLCESKEEEQTLLKACETFEDEAKDLQRRLLKRRDDEWSNSSWLQNWWNKGYLQARDPLPVHVSYFLDINDDPSLPTQEEMDAASDASFHGANNPGILRGATALTAVAEVRKRICSGQAPRDKIGGTPLCSTPYKYVFNSCRIPRLGSDWFKIYDPSLHKHCIVASRGYFFAMDFVDDDHHPLPLDMLVQRLQKVEEMAKKYEESGMPKLGFLTGCERDFWANARMDLLHVGGSKMNKALNVLESGAVVLCLDKDQPKTNSEASELFWHGNSGGNRWFDKSLQLVCTKNGQIALVCEHSLFDGMSPLVICNQIQKKKYQQLHQWTRPIDTDPGINAGIYDMFGHCWAGNKDLLVTSKDLANKAQNQHQQLTESVELKTLLYEGYGKQLIKKGRLSPDAYAQIVLQLAAYRFFGKQVATYEATQTRRFVHGRTETTRTVSLDSQAFVEAMGPQSNADDDDLETKYNKLQLLRKAAKSHHDYTIDASSGRGVDRHFLGLFLVLEDDEAPPSLFNHPAFIRSKNWRLSTSSLPNCPGFGPVVPDGLGVGYSLSNNSCVFHVSSRRENDFVNQFCNELEIALDEMRDLLECEE